MSVCADQRQKVLKIITNKQLDIGSSLRAQGNRGDVSERVRRKSNRFLPEITTMIPRIGLRCRRIL